MQFKLYNALFSDMPTHINKNLPKSTKTKISEESPVLQQNQLFHLKKKSISLVRTQDENFKNYGLKRVLEGFCKEKSIFMKDSLLSGKQATDCRNMEDI